MSSVWRDVRGYKGLYKVSDKSEVKSCARVVRGRWGDTTIKEKILTQHPQRQGYLTVKLSKDGKSKRATVHRLVAIAFLENPENKPQVNHIDGVKDNNLPKNLEWCTNSENQIHAHKIGLRSYKGEDSPRAVLTGQDVREIKYLLNVKGLTGKTIGDIYGVHKDTISAIKTGKNWKHIC